MSRVPDLDEFLDDDSEWLDDDMLDDDWDWGYLAGEKSEQERIIKLIEETLMIHTDQKFFLIRSIKGEQK